MNVLKEIIMAFCKYSTEFIASSKTELDNIFINDYLPFAKPQDVVVYVYGLYICGSSSFDNSFENFAKTLNMTEEEVVQSFEYWEEQGLVQLVRTNPIGVTYVPLKNVLSANKLYKPDKYTLFNQQANDIFMGKRAISKHEYQEYYDFLERYHFEPEALLMIMQYCVETKKSAVGYSYILTVAKNWAAEGITTTPQVEERLQKFEEKSPEMTEIFACLGIKRAPYVEERALLNKWLNEYGFNFEVILHICKNQKKTRLSFERLDGILTKYYEMNLFSSVEIDDFEKEKKEMYTIAKDVSKALGLYYENLETVVENYILKWINMGFDKALLFEVAEYCFKTSIRTLDGMDRTIAKLFKLGILSCSAFAQYMGAILALDDKIQTILDKLSVNRNVNYIDRENYKTWTEVWKISDSLIEHAITLAKGKENPLKYLSRVLADWHEKGIKTVEEAKNTSPIASQTTPQEPKKNFTGRSYSSKELNALFQSIDEIDV
ncbi:MAG: DnaD domain protein [Clostridia bacterium]|nr:DnaD domain protein [Clostridia bacterium]